MDIGKVNSFIKEIAQLNEVIHANEPTTFQANDYRDERDLKVKKLNEIIDLNYINENLSLIHISEPTRRTPISYAVFCLKQQGSFTSIAL